MVMSERPGVLAVTIAGCSRPARASALEIGKGLHSPVRIQNVTCQQRIGTTNSDVKIAEISVTNLTNAAARAVFTMINSEADGCYVAGGPSVCGTPRPGR